METEEISAITAALSTPRHQVPKLVLGTLVGYMAGKLTEKAYDAAVTCYRHRKLIAAAK